MSDLIPFFRQERQHNQLSSSLLTQQGPKFHWPEWLGIWYAIHLNICNLFSELVIDFHNLHLFSVFITHLYIVSLIFSVCDWSTVFVIFHQWISLLQAGERQGGISCQRLFRKLRLEYKNVLQN